MLEEAEVEADIIKLNCLSEGLLGENDELIDFQSEFESHVKEALQKEDTVDPKEEYRGWYDKWCKKWIGIGGDKHQRSEEEHTSGKSWMAYTVFDDWIGSAVKTKIAALSSAILRIQNRGYGKRTDTGKGSKCWYLGTFFGGEDR